MSIQATATIWAMDLPPVPKLVALAYADHAKPDGSDMYPSFEHTMKKTGLSRSSVIRGVKYLVAAGILIETGKRKSGTKVYALGVSEGHPGGVTETPEPLINRNTRDTKVSLERGKKNVKKKATRDSRLDHPAIKVYPGITRMAVPVAWRDRVIETVGEDTAHWREVLTEWIGRGFKPNNIKGQLEVFVKGFRTTGKSSASAFEKSVRALQEYVDERSDEDT